MRSESLVDAIAVAANEFTLQIADTAGLRREVFRLRHQVYCVERGYEASIGGEESDEFDAFASHLLLRHCGTGEVVGTVRVVGANPERPDHGLPIHAIIEPALLRRLPLLTTGEVSRFAISKQRRNRYANAPMMRLSLMRGVLETSVAMGLTHWCAVMERSLLRLLSDSGIHFMPFGPQVEFHGLRQPSVASIPTMVTHLRHEQPTVWNFLTAGGRLDQHGEMMLAARRGGGQAAVMTSSSRSIR